MHHIGADTQPIAALQYVQPVPQCNGYLLRNSENGRKTST